MARAVSKFADQFFMDRQTAFGHRHAEGLLAQQAVRVVPLIGGMVPGELHADVTNLGYAVIEDLDSNEQKRRYFLNRNDGLQPPPGSRLLHLRLKAHKAWP